MPKLVIFQAKPITTIPYVPFECRSEDIILAGSSDDDSDGTRQAKRQKREDAASYYLRHGQPKLISTARLRGPFEPHHVARPKRRRAATQRVATTRQRGEAIRPPAEEVWASRQGERSSVRTPVKKSERRQDSPVLRLPKIEMPSSSPTPVPSPADKRQARREQKKVGAIGTQNTTQAVLAPVSRRARRSIGYQTGAKKTDHSVENDHEKSVVEAHAQCASSPARQSLKIADFNVRPATAKDTQLTHVASLPGQSPFEFVPTRLRRRQKQQLLELKPVTGQIVGTELQESEEVVNLSGTNDDYSGQEPPDSELSVRQGPELESATTTIGQEDYESIGGGNAQFVQAHFLALPPQLPMPDMSDWTGFGPELGDNGQPRTMYQNGSQNVSEPIEPTGSLNAQPALQETRSLLSIHEPILRPVSILQASQAGASSNAVTEFLDEEQQDGQPLERSKPATEPLQTESLSLASRRSEIVVSTQAAFHDALAGLQTPQDATSRSGQSHRSSTRGKPPNYTAIAEGDLTQELAMGTQALLAQASRFSISPDMRRSRGTPKAPDQYEVGAGVRSAQSRKAMSLGDNELVVRNEVESPKDLVLSAPSAMGQNESTTTSVHLASFLSSPNKRSGDSSNPPRMELKSALKRSRKSGKRASSKHNSAQSSSESSTQGRLSGRITKSTTYTIAHPKSTFGSTKTSEFQDAQRPQDLDVFGDSGSGMLDDDQLDDTLHDIENFLGNWPSELQSQVPARDEA